MITKIEKSLHLNSLNKEQNAKSIQMLESQLDEIFRNGIKDPVQVAYVNQLLKNYYNLAGTDYKSKKENSIV